MILQERKGAGSEHARENDLTVSAGAQIIEQTTNEQNPVLNLGELT